MKMLITFFCLLPFCAFSQQQSGIAFFEGTWSELLQKAETENKYVFIDCYTDWCGPCKRMANNVFTNDTAGAFYNEHFINYKIEMEKADLKSMGWKYKVMAYPTYLFLDPKGSLAHRTTGGMPAAKFIALGETALNPEMNLSGFQKQYETGTRDAAFIYRYIDALHNADENKTVESIAEEYFASLPEEQLFAEENWKIIRDFRTNMKSSEFEFVLKNKDKFKERFGNDVSKYFKAIAYNSIFDIACKNDEAGLKNIITLLKENVDNPDASVSNVNMDYFSYASQWDKYAAEAVNNIENGYYKIGADEASQSSALNNIAWDFYKHVDDKQLLSKAEEWIKVSVQLEENYYNLDTYAAVLFKLGKKKEGKQMAKKAIAKAKTEGTDYKSTKELLEKYK